MTQRIAYLTGEYPRATDTFIQREVAALRDRGLTIHTFAVRRPDQHHAVGPEQQAERQSTYYILPASPLHVLACHLAQLCHAPGRYVAALALAFRTRSPGLGAWLYQLFYFAEAGILARQLRKRGIEHLHNHFANSSCSLAMIAAAMAGVPFSFTLHGPQIFFAPQRWALAEKIKLARFVACISYFCRSQAMVFARPEDFAKLKIIHCGIDPALFPPIDRDRPPRRLLFVGRLAPVKGLHVLLHAMPRWLQQYPDLKLDILGDGPSRADLQSLADDLGITRSVHFHGYQSQASVRDFLKRADLFVLPSFAEGVPVVVMEALASRVPTVATHIAGVPELIEHNVTGLLVAPGDVEALVRHVDALLADPSLCRRLADIGREKVLAEFNLQHEAARLAALLTADTLDPNAPPRPTALPADIAPPAASSPHDAKPAHAGFS